MGALDSAVTALGSLVGGTLINQINKRNAIEMQDRQNEYNHPSNQLHRLKQAGLNPARVFANGQSIDNTTDMASVPDSSAGYAAASSTMQAALQSSLLESQKRNIDADTKTKEAQAAKEQAETEGIMTDNQFKAALNSKNLEFMDSQTQENLSKMHLNEEETKVAKQTYENLVKSLDMIEAQTSVFKETVKKIGEETALLRVEQDIKQRLADSQIKVGEQQIRTMAATAYEAAMSGDAAKINAANMKLQGEILEIQSKEAPRREALITKNMQQQSQQENFKTRYEKAKAEQSESLAKEESITAERKESTRWLYRYTPLGVAREVWESTGTALGGAMNTAAALVK